MGILLILALACAPGAFIIGYIYFRDRFEPEPTELLAKSFWYGVLSVFVTLVVSLPLFAVIPIDPKSLSQQAIHAFFLVALVEEGSKFIFVRGILYRNKNFNEPYDGIIYSVMVSMGFATLENILYSIESGVGVALLRMFTAVPAHASFAVLMGYFLGKGKFERQSNLLGAKWVEIEFSIWALGAATLLHGAYDYCLFVDFVPGIWIGAVVSLLLGLRLSFAAIRIHQAASPFRTTPATYPQPSSPEPSVLSTPVDATGGSSSSIRCVCPSCGHQHEFEAASAGQPLECSKCRQPITLPGAA